MAFWHKKKRKSSSGNGQSSSKPTGKRKYQPLEVKVMAMEAKVAVAEKSAGHKKPRKPL